MARRFFSDDSFWNTPLPPNPPLAELNDRYRRLLPVAELKGGPHINIEQFSIPIYEVDATTPRRTVGRYFERGGVFGKYNDSVWSTVDGANRRLGLGPGFGDDVPIPDDAQSDPASDSHLVLVDYDAGRCWDMWHARRESDGQWDTYSGMTYDLYGSGVFDPADFPYPNGEKIHVYGPGRAAGVPVPAGLIMKHEVESGRIRHKIACAASTVGLLVHAFPPAIATDGVIPRGIPEGIVMQLDPALDLELLNLKPGAKIVARALQEYGACFVDYAQGLCVYAESPWTNSCNGWGELLGSEDLRGIGLDHFRFIKPDKLVERGTASPRQGAAIVERYKQAFGVGK